MKTYKGIEIPGHKSGHNKAVIRRLRMRRRLEAEARNFAYRERRKQEAS